MCSEHCLIMLYIGVKFHENISNGIRVMERTRNYEALKNRPTDTQYFRGYNLILCHFWWRFLSNFIKKLKQKSYMGVTSDA